MQLRVGQSNLNHFQQPLFHTFPPSMNLICFRFSIDAEYFILQVASLSAKILQFILQISFS